jgi:hypothetical protein
VKLRRKEKLWREGNYDGARRGYQWARKKKKFWVE